MLWADAQSSAPMTVSARNKQRRSWLRVKVKTMNTTGKQTVKPTIRKERVPSYESFLRIYSVLAQKSSREHPLTVADIHRELTVNPRTDGKEDTNRIRRLLRNPAVVEAINSTFVRTLHTVYENNSE